LFFSPISKAGTNCGFCIPEIKAMLPTLFFPYRLRASTRKPSISDFVGVHFIHPNLLYLILLVDIFLWPGFSLRRQ
jgi:hypothetical protein